MSATNRGRKRIPADAYQTPPELCEALVSRLVPTADVRAASHPGEPVRILEPSSGMGNFVRALRGEFPKAHVVSVDPNQKYPGPDEHHAMRFEDFTPNEPFDIICGNPPFSLAEAHVRRALTMLAPNGVLGFLLRLSFLEAKKRQALWRDHPVEMIYALSERPSFAFGSTDSSAYAFFMWRQGYSESTELKVLSWKK